MIREAISFFFFFFFLYADRAYAQSNSLISPFTPLFCYVQTALLPVNCMQCTGNCVTSV